MSTRSMESADQVELLSALLAADTDISGDVVPIGVGRWGIYASAPFDGTVLVAEYDSVAEAHAALSGLQPNHGLPGSEVRS